MQEITTDRLVLEPLVVAHAEAMFEVLADPEIYRYLDYDPPTSMKSLRSTYAKLQERQSPDGKELWLNWVIRPHGHPLAGYVQATVVRDDTAWVAYVLSSRFRGRGYAHEATRAMLEYLSGTHEVRIFLATVEAENHKSVRLLGRLGFELASPQEEETHGVSGSEQLFVRRSLEAPHAS